MVFTGRNAASPGPVTLSDGEIAPVRLTEMGDVIGWRYDFTLGPQDAGYRFDGVFHPVVTDLTGDMRIAFVSCNGEENGDLDRDGTERNLMWDRLAQDHEAAPFALLLQGGDQVYADEATHGHPLSHGWPTDIPDIDDPAQIAHLLDHLRHRFVERYLHVMQAPGYLRMMAQVPSLAIWDDHDICDGWGSLPDRVTQTAIGQALFRAARDAYLLFQHGAVEADVAQVFLDPTGVSLSWARELPGLSLFAPDLRSERDRHRIMGPAGWRIVDGYAPQGDQVFLISSVPLLGPRLSLLEGVMMAIPRMQHYEDDLRDQWQSRTHRQEWRRMLRRVLDWRARAPVTALSGEIHLATRAVMGADGGDDPQRVHQLVASGVSHRAPPKGYARGLGLFAGLGDAPLDGHPIRIHPLPGQRHRYVAERNYLTLHRQAGRWQARWHLEDSGVTPALDITN